MANSTLTFPFLAREVRARVDEHAAPWFNANDVCAALGISNPRDAVSRLDEDEKGVGISDTLGGPQEATFISESGLYTLILRSQDAITPGTTAHRFRKWVTAEVLPALRRHGYYGQMKPAQRLQALKTSADLARRMVESSDWCEQAHLWNLNWELCFSLGIKPPDLAKLGKKPEALPGVPS